MSEVGRWAEDNAIDAGDSGASFPWEGIEAAVLESGGPGWLADLRRGRALPHTEVVAHELRIRTRVNGRWRLLQVVTLQTPALPPAEAPIVEDGALAARDT